jgi:hypothetical protein
MANHDLYGKQVLASAAGKAFISSGNSVKVDFGTGMPGKIDGTVGNFIAVEIESRTSKQIRGAIVDLLCHPYPRKLLVVLPVHVQNPKVATQQCENILARFIAKESFRVILLQGSGFRPVLERDANEVRKALNELGFEG